MLIPEWNTASQEMAISGYGLSSKDHSIGTRMRYKTAQRREYKRDLEQRQAKRDARRAQVKQHNESRENQRTGFRSLSNSNYDKAMSLLAINVNSTYASNAQLQQMVVQRSLQSLQTVDVVA